MDTFVSQLMAKMTLKEKIGQLNLLPAGDITTGAALDTQVGGMIAAGDLGGIFNIKGRDKIEALQRIAVEKTRLGIPLIVGMDVIHGYGLTYTTLDYGQLAVEGSGRNYPATVTVTNTGKRASHEVVQLYVHDVFASIARPVKELVGFERIYLEPGETKTVSLPIDESALSYYNINGVQVFEPGDFDIMVGPNSANVQKVTISVK